MANAKKLPSGNWRIRAFCGYDKNGKQIIIPDYTGDVNGTNTAAALQKAYNELSFSYDEEEYDDELIDDTEDAVEETEEAVEETAEESSEAEETEDTSDLGDTAE